MVCPRKALRRITWCLRENLHFQKSCLIKKLNAIWKLSVYVSEQRWSNCLCKKQAANLCHMWHGLMPVCYTVFLNIFKMILLKFFTAELSDLLRNAKVFLWVFYANCDRAIPKYPEPKWNPLSHLQPQKFSENSKHACSVCLYISENGMFLEQDSYQAHATRQNLSNVFKDFPASWTYPKISLLWLFHFLHWELL